MSCTEKDIKAALSSIDIAQERLITELDRYEDYIPLLESLGVDFAVLEVDGVKYGFYRGVIPVSWRLDKIEAYRVEITP